MIEWISNLQLPFSKKNRQKILYQNIHNRINEKRNEFDSVSDITLIGHSLFDYWDVKK